MNFRGTQRMVEIASIQGAHDLIHTMLEHEGQCLGFVNKVLKDHRQQTVLYGDFGSGLHLHLLTHSLGWTWPVLFELNGKLYETDFVKRHVDDIGRIGQAIVFECKS